MTRKNKKKNSNKPPKPRPPKPEKPVLPPVDLSPEIDYLNQKPSEPPPNTDLEYAIPTNTTPHFKDALKLKLRQSFQLYGEGGDGPVTVPLLIEDILEKLSYPTAEENYEDFLIHKKELLSIRREEGGTNNELLLDQAKHFYFYLQTTQAIKVSEYALYRSFGRCPQKDFLLTTHEDLHRIYNKIVERDVHVELRKLIDGIEGMNNKSDIETLCSTKKSMLGFFGRNPNLYLLREHFKSCLSFCDLIGTTVRCHMALITELEDSFHVDGLPRNRRFKCTDETLVEIRRKRDTHVQHLAHNHRVLLANLVEKMPYFLGSAVEEYLRFDENAKKWMELKKVREEEALMRHRAGMDVQSFMNTEYKARRFLRPTSAAQIEFLRDVLERTQLEEEENERDEQEVAREYFGDSEEAEAAREELTASLQSLGLAPADLEQVMKELREVSI